MVNLAVNVIRWKGGLQPNANTIRKITNVHVHLHATEMPIYSTCTCIIHVIIDQVTKFDTKFLAIPHAQLSTVHAWQHSPQNTLYITKMSYYMFITNVYSGTCMYNRDTSGIRLKCPDYRVSQVHFCYIEGFKTEKQCPDYTGVHIFECPDSETPGSTV